MRKDKNYLKILNKKMTGDLEGLKVRVIEVVIGPGKEAGFICKSMEKNAEKT